jgi:hypothetical protein
MAAPALAALFASAVLPVLGAVPAEASSVSGCQAATVQYRLIDADGQPTGGWTSVGGFHRWSDAPQTVQVRLVPGTHLGNDCTYPVSLAAYTTQGPDWAHSGTQTYLSSSTVYLGAADVPTADGTQQQTWQTLTVPKPQCYGQIDLYGDDVKYDGGTGEGHGPLPYEPGNVVTPYHLIAAWNGGDKACTPSTPTPTPTASQPATPTPTPTPSGPASPSVPPVTPTTTPRVPPKTSPPASPASPSPSHPGLAETGAGAPVGLLSVGAALIVGIGAGALYLTRSRRVRRH